MIITISKFSAGISETLDFVSSSYNVYALLFYDCVVYYLVFSVVLISLIAIIMYVYVTILIIFISMNHMCSVVTIGVGFHSGKGRQLTHKINGS